MRNFETAKQNAEENKARLDSHRQFYKVYFDDNAEDFAFQAILLGTIRNGGGEAGEIFYTAAQIEDGNPDSWADEWRKLAERVEKKAEAAHLAGHGVTAHGAYLRSASYFRAAHGGLSPSHPDFIAIGDHVQAIFRKAMTLGEYPIEFFEIPFEGQFLDGFFIKASIDAQRRPTLFALGGGETFAEDAYFHLGPQALVRGYNFVTVSVPGQGMTPARSLHFRFDVETATRLVIDRIVARNDVDPDRIASYGFSLGGYMAPRAAAYDPRIKATCGNYGMTDFHRILKAMAFRDKSEIKTITAFNRRSVEHLIWRWALPDNDSTKIIEACENYQLDTSLLKIPTLLISSAGEYVNPVVRNMQDEFLAGVDNDNKKLVVVDTSEGGSSHCVMENTGLIAGILFDWLDETFG
jgi:esterase/lipase